MSCLLHDTINRKRGRPTLIGLESVTLHKLSQSPLIPGVKLHLHTMLLGQIGAKTIHPCRRMMSVTPTVPSQTPFRFKLHPIPNSIPSHSFQPYRRGEVLLKSNCYRRNRSSQHRNCTSSRLAMLSKSGEIRINPVKCRG